MKVFYDSVYSTKDMMYDNRSLLEYISPKKTERKQPLFDSLVGIDRARLSFYRENKKDASNPENLRSVWMGKTVFTIWLRMGRSGQKSRH